MENIKEKAISAFRSDFNCAQSVVSAFSEELNFDKKLALGISTGFGGGMGRLQKTCGAVTGAFMAMGIYSCTKYSDNQERKEHTYAMIQAFNRKFVELHGSSDCRTLLNCDLNTEEGQAYAKENSLFEKRCERFISDSIEILDELMNSND